MMPCSLGDIRLLVLPTLFMLFKIKLSIFYNLEVLLKVRTGIRIQLLFFSISVISAEELGDDTHLHNTGMDKVNKSRFTKAHISSFYYYQDILQIIL